MVKSKKKTTKLKKEIIYRNVYKNNVDTLWTLFFIGLITGVFLTVFVISVSVDPVYILTMNESEYNNYLIDDVNCDGLGFDSYIHDYDENLYACVKYCDYDIEKGEYKKYFLLKKDYDFKINYNCDYFKNLTTVV